MAANNGRFLTLSVAVVSALCLAACASSLGPSGTGGRDSGIEKISRLFDAINVPTSQGEGAYEHIVQQIAAETFVRHDLTGIIPGIEGHDGAVNFLYELKRGFSDLHLEINEIFSADDKVVVFFVATGTHDGQFLGRSATHKPIRVNNINIYRFKGGKVHETWQLYDALTLLRQIGIIDQ